MILLIIGCGSSIPTKEYEKFFKLNSFKPKDISQITGIYQQSSGLDGNYLILRSDSTFFYNHWTDLFGNPIKGYEGDYYISGDTLALIFKSTIYTDSTFIHDNLNKQQIIKNIIFHANMSAMYSPSFLINYNDNIFIMARWERDFCRNNYSQIEAFLKYDIYKGQKVGKTLLIKSE